MIKINNRQENKKYYKVIGNVVDIDSYEFDDESYNTILNNFTEYFLNNSDFLVSVENENNEIIAILGANINSNHFEFDKFNENFNNSNINEYVKFQNRLMELLSSFEFDGPELVVFSSLQKGYGSKMIKILEEELIKNNKSEYFLLTASDNTYEWYIKNNYELIEKKKLDLNNLNIADKYEVFEVMLFKKTINNI